jgi:hypothetical protein
MTNKNNQVQLRFNDEQLLYITRAHQKYQQDNEEVITRSEFMRKMIIMACAVTVGEIEVVSLVMGAKKHENQES